MKFFIKLLINAAVLVLIAYLLPGITIYNPWFSIIAAFILALVNVFLKPLLVILTLPITVITLGFFIFIINALLFWLALSITPGIEVAGFWWAFIGMIIYSIFSWLLQIIFIEEED